jgi:hypothetical protein
MQQRALVFLAESFLSLFLFFQRSFRRYTFLSNEQLKPLNLKYKFLSLYLSLILRLRGLNTK